MGYTFVPATTEQWVVATIQYGSSHKVSVAREPIIGLVFDFERLRDSHWGISAPVAAVTSGYTSPIAVELMNRLPRVAGLPRDFKRNIVDAGLTAVEVVQEFGFACVVVEADGPLYISARAYSGHSWKGGEACVRCGSPRDKGKNS